MHRLRMMGTLAGIAVAIACTSGAANGEAGQAAGAVVTAPSPVRPGITVLLEDSIHLVAGKRIGLLTNQTGIDETGRSDIDLLRSDPRVAAAGARLVRLFSPEHGIRGTEDRTHIASGVDEASGLPVVSLYGATVLPPPDSTLRDIDVLVFDLQDLGTHVWTYEASMLYAMRAAARRGIPFVVLDRPNPITGMHMAGPVLDSSVVNPEDDRPERRARPTAVWTLPLRHGLTMGELARLFNDELAIGAELHVVPAAGWRRAQWFDETGLPWVKPSPNMPSLASATVYPSTVLFEATNLSVGRGTDAPFLQIGAPWLDADSAVALLEELDLDGVRFESRAFTPQSPTDRKWGGTRVNGIRIQVTDRNRIESGRLAAALLWAVAKVGGDSLRVRPDHVDRLFGSPAAREALLRGEDPDTVMDREIARLMEFQRRARPHLIYP